MLNAKFRDMLKHKKRGQAAMEFLMTYGWSILVVLVAIGALAYFGVLNTSRFIPSSANLMPGLSVDDFKIMKNAVILKVRNGMGEDLTDVSISIPNCVGGGAGVSGTGNLEDGEVREFVIGCINNFTTRVSEDLEIYYKEAGSSISHIGRGSITGASEEGRLVAYYSFDDGTATDLSGNGNDGTLIGGVDCSVTGKYGKACYFDGIDDYINIPDDDSLDFGVEDFSIEMWVKLSPNQEASGYPGFITKSDFSSVGWIYLLDSNTNFRQKFGIYSTGLSEGWDNKSNSQIPSNGWHHISVVLDRDAIEGSVSFYLDDSFDGQEYLGPAQNVNNAEPLYIGRGWTGQYINATIDELKIYKN